MPDLCPICPCRSNPSLPGPLHGDGPKPCKYLFIGEARARDEVRRNRVFMGKAGIEYTRHYLPLSGLSRSEVRTTNAYRCHQPGFDNPTPEQGQICSSYWLHRDLEEIQPEWIIPMGAVATSLFPSLSLESHHGIPQIASYGDWAGFVYPTYHPAIGLHEGSWIIVMREDFSHLKTVIRAWDESSDLIQPVNTHPRPNYKEITTSQRLRDVISAGELDGEGPAIDTEATLHPHQKAIIPKSPHCLSFSFHPGTGYVIYCDRPNLISYFSTWLASTNPLVYLHNYLFDCQVLRMMGITVNRFDDTMIRSYNLGNLPHGLKPLAYRLCGVEMRDFADIVHPYTYAQVYEYLLLSISALHSELFTYRGKPTSKHPAGALLKNKRIRKDFSAQQTRTYNKLIKMLTDMEGGTLPKPWKRWWDWHKHDRDFLLARFPHLPLPSIAYVPRSVCTYYVGQDADLTLRIRSPLIQRATQLRLR